MPAIHREPALEINSDGSGWPHVRRLREALQLALILLLLEIVAWLVSIAAANGDLTAKPSAGMDGTKLSSSSRRSEAHHSDGRVDLLEAETAISAFLLEPDPSALIAPGALPSRSDLFSPASRGRAPALMPSYAPARPRQGEA